MRGLLLAVLLAVVVFSAASHAGGQSSFFQSSQESSPGSNASIDKQEVKTYTLPPDRYEKAVAYSKAQYRLHFIGVAYSLVVLLIMLSLRIAPAIRDKVERISRRRFVQALIFVPLVLLVFDLFKFPLDAYYHRLAVKYDISVQGWGSWLWDWTKAELLQFLIAAILIYFLVGVIRRSPSRWWLYSGLGSFPLIAFLLFISPLLIDPLFNNFTPLETTQPGLVEEIEKVVMHAGLDIPRERIFEMSASEKVNAINAYVTGFGASKRVVVWDTTIAKMTPPQTLFVVGHEMGHYVLGHIPKGIAFAGVLITVVLLLVHFAMKRALGRRQRQWALRGLDDWASFPALLMFVYLFSFFAEPVFNSYSRFQEHQADVYGLEVVHGIVPDSAQTAAEAFQILGEVDLADPAPGAFIKFWLYSHPPLAERIAFAREYDPWSNGHTPMFVR
ncbi:MAG: M48 family metallopeptidase [Blastocatellia bacterium]